METIARSAQQRYGELHGDAQAGTDDEEAQIGRRYLEKIVQIQLTLPPPGGDGMQELYADPPRTAPTVGAMALRSESDDRSRSEASRRLSAVAGAVPR